MAMGGRNKGPRFALGTQAGGGLMPTPGSTEHATFVLVVLELAALVFLRRYMRSSHGG